MKTIALASLFLLLAGCGSNKSQEEAIIKTMESDASCHLMYESHDTLLAELNRKATNELWSSEKLASEQAKLPLGGEILVFIEDSTMDGANTKWWTFEIETLDGKRILYEDGENSTPEYTTQGSKTTWWNIHRIRLGNVLSSPINLTVTNNLADKNSAFIIYPKGSKPRE